MEKLVINGGKPLKGKIKVSGSKNAALPILCAAILMDRPVEFRNVPSLRDIRTTLRLLDVVGCPAAFDADHPDRVKAEPRKLLPEAPYDLVKTMRASVLVLGPLLARLGEAKVALPGGCAIGARPVDQHLKALARMGVEFDLNEGYIYGRCKELIGADISFDFPTVGGTEHLLMAAALAKGCTILRNAAKEPEVSDLAHFLNACGARIQGIGTDTLTIEGVKSLKAVEPYSVMPDRIEAGTFLIAGAITHGELDVEGCPVDALSSVLAKLEEMNVKFEHTDNCVRVKSNGPTRNADIVTKPYPGFPTDMQAQFMGLMSVSEGAGTVEETIFENRFMHVPELIRMGADIRLSGSKAVIRGVKQLAGAPVMASDLRASATLVLAGLSAKGQTHVQRIYHLDRGYENIEHKLRAVGADIERVREEE